MLKGLPATTGDDFPLNMTTLFRHAARNFPDRGWSTAPCTGPGTAATTGPNGGGWPGWPTL